MFYEELKKFNIQLTAVDTGDSSSFEAALRPNTKVRFCYMFQHCEHKFAGIIYGYQHT